MPSSEPTFYTSFNMENQSFFVRLLLVPIRSICRFFRDLDGLMTAVVRWLLPPVYQLEGECKKRGICCQNIAIYLNARFWRLTPFKQFAMKWYEFVYNFEFLGESQSDQVLIFRCRYLKEGKCSIHYRRPFLCRFYPSVRYFDSPRMAPGCGYRLKKGFRYK